jgi:hypothetical protein
MKGFLKAAHSNLKGYPKATNSSKKKQLFDLSGSSKLTHLATGSFRISFMTAIAAFVKNRRS